MEVSVDLGNKVSIPKSGPAKEMISVRQEGTMTHVRINSSSLGIIQDCLRKAQYRLHEGWLQVDESPATIFGTGIHAALEIYYSGNIGQRSVPKIEDLERMALGFEVPGETDDLSLRAARAMFDKMKPLRELPDTDKRHPLNAAYIFHQYAKQFYDDPYVALEDDDGQFLERKFDLRLHEGDTLTIDIFGTIDFAFRHVGNDSIIVGDHKTTSSLGWAGQSYFDREKPNLQYSCYIMGAREVFGLDVQNFMVNILEVKTKPKTPRGKGPQFPRQITTRNQDDLDEFRETVIYFTERYIEAREKGFWPLGPVGACNSYGSCEFRQVCSAPKILRQNILSNKFKRAGE